MSHVVRRKHVLKEMMEDDFATPTEQQEIVRVHRVRGNNLLEVESADENVENFLASIPCKYRKNIWFARGDFVLVEPITEGVKVKAEICKLLTPEHVKEYTKAGVWPARFTKKRAESPPIETEQQTDDDDDDDEGEDDGFVVRNYNRPVITTNVNTEETDSDEDTDDTEDESDDTTDDDDESEDDDIKEDNSNCKNSVKGTTEQIAKL